LRSERRKPPGRHTKVIFRTDKILIKAGFEKRQPRKGSSHYIYTKGTARIVVPYHQPHVKAVYAERVIKILEGEINND